MKKRKQFAPNTDREGGTRGWDGRVVYSWVIYIFVNQSEGTWLYQSVFCYTHMCCWIAYGFFTLAVLEMGIHFIQIHFRVCLRSFKEIPLQQTYLTMLNSTKIGFISFQLLLNRVWSFYCSSGTFLPTPGRGPPGSRHFQSQYSIENSIV